MYLLNLLQKLLVDIANFTFPSESQICTEFKVAIYALVAHEPRHEVSRTPSTLVEDVTVTVNYIPTHLRLSDCITKHPPKPIFVWMRQIVQTFHRPSYNLWAKLNTFCSELVSSEEFHRISREE